MFVRKSMQIEIFYNPFVSVEGYNPLRRENPKDNRFPSWIIIENDI